MEQGLFQELEELLKKMKITSAGININIEETVTNLSKLRRENPELKKYVCRFSRLHKNSEHIKFDTCNNNFDCKNCTIAEEGTIFFHENAYNDIVSRKSLGKTFGRDKGDIDKFESGRFTNLPWDRLLAYAYIAKVPLSDILVLEGDFYFDHGIIVRKGDPEYTPLNDNKI